MQKIYNRYYNNITNYENQEIFFSLSISTEVWDSETGVRSVQNEFITGVQNDKFHHDYEL